MRTSDTAHCFRMGGNFTPHRQVFGALGSRSQFIGELENVPGRQQGAGSSLETMALVGEMDKPLLSRLERKVNCQRKVLSHVNFVVWHSVTLKLLSVRDTTDREYSFSIVSFVLAENPSISKPLDNSLDTACFQDSVTSMESEPALSLQSLVSYSKVPQPKQR